MVQNVSNLSSKDDPSVVKQYDSETPKPEQITDFYAICDGLKIGLLTTQRKNVGIVSRSMAVAKRTGPDFLFIANKNSKKFEDIESNEEVQVTFQNSSSQDWVSITGKATVSPNSDPRIKQLYSKSTAAWFGDLGDGVHDGGPEDPRIALIEVKSSYVGYWKAKVGLLGYIKEIGVASLTGQVADTGYTRELSGQDLEAARREEKSGLAK